MGDTFEIVALSVGKVVHGVGIPFIASANVWDVKYAVDERVAEEHVGMRHVYLGTKY